MTTLEPIAGSVPSSEAARHVTSEASSWSALAIQVLIVVAGFVVLWPSTRSLMDRWNDTDGKTYTHGYLIVLITLWLLWRDRARLSTVVAAPQLAAIFGTLGASCIWLVSLRSGIQTGHQVLLPVIIWLSIASAIGLRAAFAAIFPVGYLYFAIPIWGTASDVLQLLTVKVVGICLHLSDVVAYVQGNFVHLPSGTFQIAAGCSGIHFFIVALALAALYGEIHHDSLKVRLQMLLLAGVLSAATNWVRVYIIVVAGYLTNMQHYLVRVEHYRFGWMVFAVMMAIFMLIVRRFPTQESTLLPQTAISPIVSKPFANLAAAAATIAAMLVGPAWNQIASAQAAPLQTLENVFPGDSSGTWRGPSFATTSNWKPEFPGADRNAISRYSRAADELQLYVAMYGSQRQGKEMVTYDNSVLGEEDSEIVAEGISDGWREMRINDPSSRDALIWYRYEVGPLRTTSGLRAQLRYGITSLFRPTLSKLVAIRMTCIPNCDSSRRSMGGFVRQTGLDDGRSGSELQ